MTEPETKKAKQIDVDEEKNRLLGIWELISNDLRSKVNQGDLQTITFLAKEFSSSEYPAINTKTVHCVFCHVSFDPRMPKPCETEHMWDDFDRHRNSQHRNSYSCLRCEATADFKDDEMPGGYCRDDYCSDDIYERLSHNWSVDEDDDDRFDGCSICERMAAEAEAEESDDDDEDEAENENEDKEINHSTKKPEVIEIDDD